MPNAIIRPPPAEVAVVSIEGGGGTAWPLSLPTPFMRALRDCALVAREGGGGTTGWGARPTVVAAAVLCSDIGSCGAGATAAGPMLTSPTLRNSPSTEGGGATIETSEVGIWRVVAPLKSGAGATTTVRGALIRRLLASWTSGAGATGVISGSERGRREGDDAGKGAAGIAWFHATMLGVGTSCASFRSGGVMMVCDPLSDSVGTEMIGWLASSGCPFWATGVGALPVSIGCRYSEGE
jgi:hypothetical protein